MERGKKVCRELNAVRKQIADANEIDFTPRECTHQGDCPGTCPACEDEVRYIENQLSLRQRLGKAVVLAGLSLAVSSCGGCASNQPVGIVPYEPDSTEVCSPDSTKTPTESGEGEMVMLEGDVCAPVPEKNEKTQAREKPETPEPKK